MAVTELDHAAIETRIVDILQANTDLYTTTGEVDKLRLITKGHPFSHTWRDKIWPYAFVSFKNSRNVLFGARDTDEIQGIKQIVTYQIIFGADAKTGRVTEAALNAFQKTIMETLEEDVQLKDPAGSPDPNDPLCVYSFINVDGTVPESIGFEHQARSLSLICLFRTGTNTSRIVNSSNVTLTNTTDGLIAKFLFNVKPFISSNVFVRQLSNNTLEKHFDIRDFAIEADIFLDRFELGTWVAFTVQANNQPPSKSWAVAFTDENGNTATLTGTMRLSALNYSATDDRDANFHIRLESVDGVVAVT